MILEYYLTKIFAISFILSQDVKISIGNNFVFLLWSEQTKNKLMEGLINYYENIIF